MSFRKLFFLFLVTLSTHNLIAQQDTCNLRISLLTCSPGDDLYSVFGHSAIRIVDQHNHRDLIYNYGTFDFEDPDFYINFVKGKPIYALSVQRYPDFVYEYQLFNRQVIEQRLNLSCDKTLELARALDSNAQENNRYYKYEWLFDNCSTRPRDMIIKAEIGHINFDTILPQPAPTFRNLIHEYLDKGDLLWSKLGIDLLLGSRIDRPSRNREAMFLPDYLMKGIDRGHIDGQRLSGPMHVIVPFTAARSIEKSWFTPLPVTIVIMILGLVLPFLKIKPARLMADIFDVALFLGLGLLGCLILFMWFGTEHQWCVENFNLAWALPTHVFVAFFILRRKKWVNKYFLYTAILYGIVVFGWQLIPQGMNPAFIPVALIAGVRSLYRSGKITSHGK